MGQNESTIVSTKVTATEKEEEEEKEVEEYNYQQVDDNMSSAKSKGITVVNPRPEDSVKSHEYGSLEIQKLNNLPKFWPILKSTLDYEYPLETFQNGLSSTELLQLCQDYKKHLNLMAQVVANEQKALTSRMKDIEMFSAGIAQQLARRHDRIEKALPHLEKVSELSQTLDNISSLLDSVVPLMNRLNYSLPEATRLEHLTIHTSSPTIPPPLMGGQGNLILPSQNMGTRLEEHENHNESEEEEVNN